MKRCLPLFLRWFAIVSLVLVPIGAVAQERSDADKLLRAVNANDILRTLRQFQEVAERNNDTRASGTPGYDLSADYVEKLLARRGYTVTRQAFEFPFFQEIGPAAFERISPDPRVYTAEEFGVKTFSGSGDVTAPITPVDVQIPPPAVPGSTSGCEAEDFAGFPAGNIALIQRGTCTFEQKAQNAVDAGAVAVIIFNEGQPGRTDPIVGTLGRPFDLPVIGTSFAIGEELYNLSQQGPVTVRVQATTISEFRTTENVIADSPWGSEDDVVVVGAHLDSVIEGPGINDNGSGTAAILEIALELTKTEFEGELQNKVRFAFWGAEELGLLGSAYYVNSLSEEERAKISLYLNFDMVGSPNYVRFVYDGDDSDGVGAGPGPVGSAQIEDVFEEFFASRGLASEGTDFTGRSDYGPFIAVGIPAGGLFTGAEGIKTEEQAEVYGGVAGVPYDPCYHEPCDSLFPTFEFLNDEELEELYRQVYDQLQEEYDLRGNVNVDALEEMSDAAAYTTLYFAQNDLIAVEGNMVGVQGIQTHADHDHAGHHAVR